MLISTKNWRPATAGLVAITLVVVSCGPTEPLPKFNSEEERKCYLTADAALQSDNYSLVRKGDTFIEVVRVEGFVRDTRPSKVFDACMVQLWGDNAPNKLSATGTLRFTSEEQAIWNGLTDGEKDAAYRFIRNGGTLSGWASANNL